MSAGVETLEAAIDALTDVDLDGLDDGTLHELTVATQRLRDRLDVSAGRLLARWDDRQVWRNDQSLSPAARLSRELNASMRTARSRLRHAHALVRVPAVTAAVGSGRASPDHVALLARAQRRAPDRYADDEAMLLEHCTTLRFADAERVVSYWLHHADPDGAAADAAGDAERSGASVSETIDGTVIIDATLTGPDAHVFLDELRRLTTAQRHGDTTTGVVRTARQHRAAALIEMATRSAATPPGARRPRPLFTVLVGEDMFRHLCETSARRVISPGSLVPHLDTADMEVVLFDDAATVISVSPRRTFAGALRRAIEVRDRHCQHPSGCDVPADRCDVDHIVAWTAGGRTDQFNGRLECPAHNRHTDLHDTDGVSPPSRGLAYLDHVRARLRWQLQQEPPDELAG
jgi:hypothetical protein